MTVISFFIAFVALRCACDSGSKRWVTSSSAAPLWTQIHVSGKYSFSEDELAADVTLN